MSIRNWISTLTLVMIALVLFFSRKELIHAWQLLSNVNFGILALTIPVILFSHIAGGEMVFSYLRQKKLIKQLQTLSLARLSLEMNFVNHVLPSGGVSGISYMTWRLHKMGVPTSKATMAQAIRYVAGFAAFIFLLAIGVFVITVDGGINRWLILISSSLITMMVATTLVGIYLLSSPKRIKKVATWIEKTANGLVRKITRGKKRKIIEAEVVQNFFDDMHQDLVQIKKERKVLLQPFLWGIAFTIAEVAVFAITFWALGTPVNPASILISYGVASVAGFIVVTPGGAGAYEAIMVFVLTLGGMTSAAAIAGSVLSRVIILLVTIGVGYIFYQLTLNKYGKSKKSDSQR